METADCAAEINKEKTHSESHKLIKARKSMLSWTHHVDWHAPTALSEFLILGNFIKLENLIDLVFIHKQVRKKLPEYPDSPASCHSNAPLILGAVSRLVQIYIARLLSAESDRKSEPQPPWEIWAPVRCPPACVLRTRSLFGWTCPLGMSTCLWHPLSWQNVR